MATEILVLRGDNRPLGRNWLQKFIKRHPKLHGRFVPPLDKERANTQTPEILSNWFNLYREIKAKYNVADSDT